MDNVSSDELKRRAAACAMDFVEPGMRLGLGTGSTAAHFVTLLGAAVAGGLEIVGVPTSRATEIQARSLNIPLSTLDDLGALDLTVDGADELDGQLRLIKGGGGALLREKIVAAASARMLVIADGAKQVETLGTFPLPVEVIAFGLVSTMAAMARALDACRCPGPMAVRIAKDGAPFVTDEGHGIVDLTCGAIPDPERLAAALAAIPGVVEHGLFIGLASDAVIATAARTLVLRAQKV